MRNHSATHLLHQALKDTLGEHVNQAGSIVLSNRLRFDFTHFEGLTIEEMKEIELKVNQKVLEALEVKTIKTSLKEAKETGAIGLFEGKYGDEVRIIKMGDYSQELCGGTHVKNTGAIGLFKIISETGIASGVRRIEAITGMETYRYLNHLEKQLDDLGSVLKTNKENLLLKSQSIVDELKQKDRDIEKMKKEKSKDISKEILDAKKEIKGINLITYRLEDVDMDGLRNLGDELKNKIESAVIVLASTVDDKILFLTMVTKDLNKKGILAGNIVREVAKATGGNGGGRPDMAQAGGKDISKLNSALENISALIEESIKS
jgi:alanyl-tRNA synthetase